MCYTSILSRTPFYSFHQEHLKDTKFRLFILGSVQALLCTRVNMLALNLIITESSMCLRDFSDIYKETDAFGNTRKYLTVWNSIYIELSTLSCRVSYVSRLAKFVNVPAIRQLIQGTETTWFRIGITLHSCQYVALDLLT